MNPKELAIIPHIQTPTRRRFLGKTLIGLSLFLNWGGTMPILATTIRDNDKVNEEVDRAFPSNRPSDQRMIENQVDIFVRRAKNIAVEASQKGEGSITVPIGDLDKIGRADTEKKNLRKAKLQEELREKADLPQRERLLLLGIVASMSLALGGLKLLQKPNEA